ncbi:hypothetical protein NB723_003147 [Xanthomonas sacchari]|nr:hypothetical protein [Xanthomonas sacchari]
MLDLALAGDRTLGIAQLRHGIDAGVVETPRQFLAQPRRIGMVAQFQLAQQRLRVGLALLQRRVVAHAEVHQAGAELGLVDPVGDAGVVAFVDQQRLREAVQHALDRAAPGSLVGLHLHQLADERQGGFGQAGLGAQPRAQRLHRRGNARGRLQQRLDLGADDRETAFVLAALGHAFGDRLVQAAGLAGDAVAQRTRLRHLFGEAAGAAGQAHAELAAGLFDLAAAAHALVALALDAAAFALQRLDLLAALRALLGLQLGQGLLVVVQRFAALPFLAGQAAVLRVQFLQARVQQGQAALLAVTVDAQLQFAQLADAVAQRQQFGVVVARRGQGFHLAPRGHHRVVRAVEFGKVLDQAVGGLEGARLVEHEAAQEGVEIAQVLRRLGLVQQPQRHLVADAEQVAEALGVAGEAVEVVHVLAQAQLEPAQVQVEAVQFGGHVEAARHHHVVLAHVGRGGAAAGDPEQPHQAHRLTLCVAVLQRQRRPGRALAQVLGGDLAGGAVLLVGPGAAHVGHQAAVAAAALGLARGGVEVDDARRRQQRRHRIEQGRLARAGTADEQEALLGDRHVGQAVEGAPVVHLQAAHAVLLCALLGQGLGEQGRGDGDGGRFGQGRHRKLIGKRGRPPRRPAHGAKRALGVRDVRARASHGAASATPSRRPR